MNPKYLLSLSLSLFLLACSNGPDWFPDWPERHSTIQNVEEDTFVKERLAQMTLEEKIAQMLMVENKAITPQEAKDYKIGALLHGGGQISLANETSLSTECQSATYLSLKCWNEFADSYWNALKEAEWNASGQAIPILFGTDAMHGAGAIHGATLFPHNIGLGAAVVGDRENLVLIYKMYKATREQVALQGFRQIFSPAISVARNSNWGRTYESLSEDPKIQFETAPYAVSGIQAPWYAPSQQRIASTLKHYVGDGGTTTGTGRTTLGTDKGLDPSDSVFTLPRTDRGLNEYSEELLINLHSPGYFSGIEAGAYSVMISFNSWKNGKIHGDEYLVQQILKDRLKFDGVVVTDWDGIQEVEGCSASNCPKAVVAGIDMFMISHETPNAWKDFYTHTLAQVKAGEIPMERIDDAVKRILKMKYRLGLFDSPKPSDSYLSFDYKTIEDAQRGLDQWAALSKSLAEKSVVLLKNHEKVLPLKKITEETPLLVAGSALDSPQMQLGGWGMQWQGFNQAHADPFHYKADYPQTVTVLDALKKQGVPLCDYAHPENDCLKKAKIALVVIGEHPYSEWYGDIHVGNAEGGNQSIAFSSIRPDYAKDEALVKDLKKQGYKVVTIFFSGRPLVTDALTQSDSFIAAFLPGSQGGPALVDLIFAKKGAEFTARLPYAWPISVENTAAFHGKPGHFKGTDQQWMETLEKGKAKENLVGPEHPYPYGFGLYL